MRASKFPRLQQNIIRSSVCVIGLLLMLLFTACAGVSSSNSTGSQSTKITGTIVSVNPAQHTAVLNVNGQQITINGLTDQEAQTLLTQVGKVATVQVNGTGNSVTIDPNSTLEVDTTPSSNETPSAGQTPIPTQPSTSFHPGGISFIGPVKSINSSSLVMSAPNGQSYSMAITPQTDLSAYNGSRPTVNSSVNMDAVINPDGSFTATILKPAQAGDPDLNVIAYTGITTSAVGADRIIHFAVGTKSYTYTIPTTADLSDFGGNAQAIGNTVSVKVKVLYTANIVVSVKNASS